MLKNSIESSLSDVVEFVFKDGELDLGIRTKNKCGSNCNQCQAPTCKATCKSCKKAAV
jgi:hypothetical protein